MDQSSNHESLSRATIDALRKAAIAANAGDTDAQVQLHRLLDENSVVWRTVGDLATRARAMLIQQAAGGDELTGESLRRTIIAMQRDLLGPSPRPLERMLAERTVSGWLHAQVAEIGLASAKNKTAADHWRRIRKSANQMYLSAAKSLESVQRRSKADKLRLSRKLRVKKPQALDPEVVSQ